MDVIGNILGKGKKYRSGGKLNRCSICKTTYTDERLSQLDRPDIYPAGEKFGKGRANLAFRLPCGHYLLDDRSSKCNKYAKDVM